LEADLIEEVARIYGYDRIPEATAIAETPLETVSESSVPVDRAATTLIARDYREAITYSFIDRAADALVAGAESSLELKNPISSEMAVMRSSLWPGLLQAASANLARQQDRVRLFEIGRSYHGSLTEHTEVMRIAAVATGAAFSEQWASKPRNIDFFDVKADVAALLDLAGIEDVGFETCSHPALQPGQAATVLRAGKPIGLLGKVHPRVAKHFDVTRDVFVFVLDAEAALASSAPRAAAVSRYPSIRRDIAVVVPGSVSGADLIRAIRETNDSLIQGVRIFDIYTGSGIEAGRKSVALGLILQETSRTLTDDDADTAIALAVQKLQHEFGAELRD
jgi:phenylalanyl-tRNA synthetase beta chain